MRSGCSLCSGSIKEGFHGAKHQRVEKRKNNFLKDNYMLVIGAVLVVAFLMYRQSKK
jgi:hypothetical protein